MIRKTALGIVCALVGAAAGAFLERRLAPLRPADVAVVPIETKRKQVVVTPEPPLSAPVDPLPPEPATRESADDLLKLVVPTMPPSDATKMARNPMNDTTLDPVALMVLSTPAAFEEAYFKSRAIPATVGELGSAARALVDQVHILPEYVASHPVMAMQLNQLSSAAAALLADNSADAAATVALRQKVAKTTGAIRQTTQAIATRTYRETPESLQVTKQIDSLAEVLERYQPSQAHP